jgi:hypothetical protein
VIALSPFSMSRAAGPVTAATGATVVTTSRGAVRKPRHLLLPAKVG